MAARAQRRYSMRNAAGRNARLVAAGLVIMACAFGQPNSNSRALGRAQPSLRVSITTGLGSECNRLLTADDIQQDAQEWLRNAGITVSNVHNARLTIGVDCVIIPSGRRGITECLALAEPIAATSSIRPTLATTWRRCASSDCIGAAQCQATVASGLHSLADTLLTDLQQRGVPKELPRKTGISTEATLRAPQLTDEDPRTPAEASIATDAPGSITVPLMFYSAYIVTCLIMFFYWQFRQRRA